MKLQEQHLYFYRAEAVMGPLVKHFGRGFQTVGFLPVSNPTGKSGVHNMQCILAGC